MAGGLINQATSRFSVQRGASGRRSRTLVILDKRAQQIHDHDKGCIATTP
jgi:hypothetical protein